MEDDRAVRLATIITLGVVLVVAVIGLTLIALFTDRDLARAATLTFCGVVFVGVLGGLSWAQFRRRRRWHVTVDRNGEERQG